MPAKKVATKEPSQSVQLEKFITGELQILSPLEALSVELKEKAEAVTIDNGYTYSNAKAVRRELVTHRNTVKDMRLTFTRKLDNLKDQFIKKQDLVLKPSIAGEALIREKISVYEADVQRRKDAEIARMNAILDKFVFEKPLRASATLEEIARLRGWVKMELGLLDNKDRNKVAIKDKVAEIRVYLRELEEFVVERDRQAAEAEAQRVERERLKAEREALEAEKAKAIADSKVELPTEVPHPNLSRTTYPELAKDMKIDEEINTREDPESTEHVNNAQDEIDKLATYLMKEWPEEIINGSAVDVVINIMNKFKEKK